MHLATAGEGPCFTNDDYTRLKMHIPTGTECPPGQAQLCDTGRLLITFLAHALAPDLGAGQNDVVNKISLLCGAVRRGLALAGDKHAKTLLISVRSRQGDLVCPLGVVMKVLLLAIIAHRPTRLDTVVIMPHVEKEREALTNVLNDFMAEYPEPAPDVNRLKDGRALDRGRSKADKASAAAKAGATAKSSMAATSGQAEAKRRGAKVSEAFWRGPPPAEPRRPRVPAGTATWSEMSTVELRAHAAHARSLGPHYSQQWLGHVQSTRRGGSAEHARDRDSLLSFLRAQCQAETLPRSESPSADEYAEHCDPRQRALAGVVAQVLQRAPSLRDGRRSILLSQARGARGIDPRRHGWRVLDAALAGWLQGADEGAKETLPRCQRRPEITLVEEEEDHVTDYANALNLPEARALALDYALRGLNDTSWANMRR